MEIYSYHNVPVPESIKWKAESALKIVKSIIKNSQRNKKDLWLFILDWRNNPTESVERLFLRRTKTALPTTSALLTPKVAKGENVTKLLNDKRIKKQNYDRSSRSLRDLCVTRNEFVRVQPLNPMHLWKLGKIILQYAPRSFICRRS